MSDVMRVSESFRDSIILDNDYNNDNGDDYDDDNDNDNDTDIY